MRSLIILIIVASFFLTTNGFSQDKGYVAISLGLSTPIGDFASKAPNNSSAGYATPGAVFDVSFGYKFGKYFGMAVLLRGQANGMDAQAIADELSMQMPVGVNGMVESGAWSIGGFMVGGYGSFPISKKVSFESRIMFGFLSATSPEVTIDLAGYGATAWVKQESASSLAFAHLLGVGFKYDVGRRICLLANFDYLGAKPEFRKVETITSLGTIESNTYSQTFGTINYGIGIGYRL